MSEAAGTGATARLDELAAVTREYARYSYVVCGLAHTVAGAWYVAAFVIAVRSQTWGRIAGLWSPFVAVSALVVGNRYYQRFGQVTETRSTADSTRLRRLMEWNSALFTAWTIANAAIHLDAWSRGDPLAYWAVVSAVATIPFVHLMTARVRAGGMVAMLPIAVMFAVAVNSDSRGEWILTKIMMGALALSGMVTGANGVREHVGYRRLERRLAALRSPPT